MDTHKILSKFRLFYQLTTNLELGKSFIDAKCWYATAQLWITSRAV